MAGTREGILKLIIWILIFLNILQFLYRWVDHNIPENTFNASFINQNNQNVTISSYSTSFIDNHYDNDTLIIHQIWLGPRHPPLSLMRDWNIKHNIYCANNHYILWSDMKNLDNVKNMSLWDIRNVSKLFESIKKNHITNINNYLLYNMTLIYDIEDTLFGKADILRLIVLYLYGGIYIDADSAWINYEKCLNSLFNQFKKGSSVFAALEPNSKWPANGVIGVKGKQNVLIKQLFLDLVINYTKLRINQKKAPWQVMGPKLLERNQKYITVFPSEYFYPMKWHDINQDIDLRNESMTNIHSHRNYSNNTYMFQYGISTNIGKIKIQWRRRREGEEDADEELGD